MKSHLLESLYDSRSCDVPDTSVPRGSSPKSKSPGNSTNRQTLYWQELRVWLSISIK